MIVVLASIRVKSAKQAEFLDIFKQNIPKVREEKGCIEYFPTIDCDAGLPIQILDGEVVTIIEKWESLAALNDHLASSHMLDYREKVKDLVEEVSLKVLAEA
ncbi:putative quinol monooxygenase [Geomonas sp.]|uniref:putative quinol monooxygenase n=1 Tax=Geomonas sp. TaxID=2651584 RepID=UPI002B468F61|nr:putative quinol monooxygenase [Geomonas sp.]HJV35549.1 putative quinol monooxygenase [Geomonas sp.]